MIALYIILGVFSVFAFLLFCNISLRLGYDDKFSGQIKYLFLKFKIPSESKTISKINKSDSDKINQKPSCFKKSVKEKGIINTVKEISEVLSLAVKKLGKLTKHIVIKKLKLHITVANDDPAVTGIEYGAVWAVLTPIISTIDNNFVLKKKRMDVVVNSNFTSNEQELTFNAVLKVRLWYLLKVALSVLIGLVKKKMNKSAKKLRSVDYGRK